jgi:hypothetical protein
MKTSGLNSLAVVLSAGAIASLGVLHCCASTPKPPPDPQASCASEEYKAEKQATPVASSEYSLEPEVVLGNVAGRINTSEQVEMGRQVTVCVKGLYNWIYIQKNKPADLRLFIGGQILSTVKPSSLSPPAQEYVDFMLEPDSPDSADWKAWATIVGASRQSSNNKLTISVAQGSQVFESNAVTTVIPYPMYWPYLVGVMVCLLAVLWILAWKTTLLRYTVGANPKAPQTGPFSLGLVQMAFWFFLAIGAYVYICASTLQIHIPMGSVLGLLGISATTGLAASAVDARKTSMANKQKNDLLIEKDALTARITDLQSARHEAGSDAEKELSDKKSGLATVNASIARLPAAPGVSKSQGFFKDILNDGDGISFHRFQIAVWTVALGCVFVWGVYRNMSMPEFDASLLTLMGISSGTYVGFKVPEVPKTSEGTSKGA